MPYAQKQGFTLVEVAIVLVIIGLLLGGILKGQELINSAKAKSIANEIKNVAIMITTYQDRFRALPGDDALVNTRFTSPPATRATTPSSAQGNGLIEGNWDSNSPTDESILFWQHVRLANLATGSTATPTESTLGTWIPTNSVGGRLGVTSVRPSGAPATLSGHVFVCEGNLTGRIAQQVDASLDDGNGKTGSIAIFVPTTGGVDTSVDTPIEATLYSVCMGI